MADPSVAAPFLRFANKFAESVLPFASLAHTAAFVAFSQQVDPQTRLGTAGAPTLPQLLRILNAPSLVAHAAQWRNAITAAPLHLGCNVRSPPVLV